jgi:hypothetical protein
MVHIEMQENLSNVGTACTLNALPRDRTGCHKNKRNNEPRKYLTVIYIHSRSAEPVINGTVGMKFLHILFMKRHRAGERSHVDSSRKSIYSRILIRKKRAETGHTWDESTTSQESDGAPWRIGTLTGRKAAAHFTSSNTLTSLFSSAENILIDGAPRGADWWQDTVHRRGSAEVEAQAQQNDEGGSTQAEEINIKTPFEESHGEELKSFRNCGLETWVQVQQAWRRPSGMETGRARIPVRKLKQELVKRMSEYRKFDLPHRLPLKDVIEAYTETWDGESD